MYIVQWYKINLCVCVLVCTLHAQVISLPGVLDSYRPGVDREVTVGKFAC